MIQDLGSPDQTSKRTFVPTNLRKVHEGEGLKPALPIGLDQKMFIFPAKFANEDDKTLLSPIYCL